MNKANSSMRDSNMELYRIIAMLMVILLHVFGEYNIIYKQYHTPEHIINILLTCTTFVCVDMFVLLSGWYGINTRWEKIKAFIFQVLFYSIALYIIILTFFDTESFSWRFFTHIFIFDSYWFIPVYLMLYLFAPALNPFIKQSSHKQYLTILVSLIVMQTIYGCLNMRESGYFEGCSPISFVILYFLGAYLHRFSEQFNKISKKTWLFFFIMLVSLSCILALLSNYMLYEFLSSLAWKFSSPIVIAAAACLLLLFSKINIGYNRFINWIAASSFAAFLIHCFPPVYQECFSPLVRTIYQHFTYPIAIFILIGLTLVLYVLCILIDQIRIRIYSIIK